MLEHQQQTQHALIVDDDPGIRDVYQMALSDLGFAPIEAADGHEALQKTILFAPKVIIVDHFMPGLTGIEFTAKVRALGMDQVPIFLVSAGRDLEQKALQAGVTGCLEKPFDIEHFIKLIESTTQSVDAMQHCS